MRIYDTRLGKFLSVDPLFKGFPWNSTYAYAENDVIRCIDIDGGEKYVVTGTVWLGSGGTILSNIKTVELSKPGPLGSGIVYNIKYDTYEYSAKGRTGNQFNSVGYIPATQKKDTRNWFQKTWDNAWKKILDGGASDKGSGGGSHQAFGIIFTKNEDGMGSTKTGAGDKADFFEVQDNGILGLLGSTGGGLSVVEMAEDAGRKISNLAKGIEELSSGSEAGSKAFEKSVEVFESPTASPANTKQGTVENVTINTQAVTPARPIKKSNTPSSKHGYSILTGIYKDTVITKVNKPGDTTRTYKQVIVPIKPRKVKG